MHLATLLVLNMCAMTSLAHYSVFQREYIFSAPLFISLLKDILANLIDEGTCQYYLLEKEPKHTVGVHKETTKMLKKNLELMLNKEVQKEFVFHQTKRWGQYKN